MSCMFKNSKKYKPTYVLIALNIAVYIFTSVKSGDFLTMYDSVLAFYGQYNRLVLEQGWYWQLFTSMFVHVNIVHIAGNMLFLLIFGLRAEEMFDLKEYLLIYLLSGLVGNLLTLLYGLDMVSAGASGAIFGVFGAVAIYARRVYQQPIMGALVYAFFMLVLTLGTNVNIFAHLGGLAIGLMTGYVFAALRKAPPTYEHRYSYSI